MRLNGEVLLNWDDKGCRDPLLPRFEEHFLRERHRMGANRPGDILADGMW